MNIEIILREALMVQQGSGAITGSSPSGFGRRGCPNVGAHEIWRDWGLVLEAGEGKTTWRRSKESVRMHFPLLSSAKTYRISLRRTWT